jgi:hypothetical protein
MHRLDLWARNLLPFLLTLLMLIIGTALAIPASLLAAYAPTDTVLFAVGPEGPVVGRGLGSSWRPDNCMELMPWLLVALLSAVPRSTRRRRPLSPASWIDSASRA